MTRGAIVERNKSNNLLSNSLKNEGAEHGRRSALKESANDIIAEH